MRDKVIVAIAVFWVFLGAVWLLCCLALIAMASW
jgi:hypothetical protein